jgi:hypothetical protein
VCGRLVIVPVLSMDAALAFARCWPAGSGRLVMAPSSSHLNSPHPHIIIITIITTIAPPRPTSSNRRRRALLSPGTNFNRAFPGAADGDTAAQLAYFISHALFPDGKPRRQPRATLPFWLKQMAAVTARLLRESLGNDSQWEESTLLYVLSHTTPHANLHISKSTEA